MARIWRRPVSPRGFLRLAVGSVGVLGLVVVSGAFVRLTGSGLGCEDWPNCGETVLPAADGHALIEFGNRIVSLAGILATLAVWLAARRVPGLSRGARILALAAFLGTVAQAPLGGITVLLELHPLAVMSHFLLALVVVALAVMVAFEAWSHHCGLAASPAPAWLRMVALGGVAACAVMVVTGAVATASGPHPGDDSDVDRLGIQIADTVYVHVRATAVYGIGLLVVGWWLLRLRRSLPGVVRLAGALLATLLVQMVVGEVQYRNALPWGLVLVHVTLAAAVWALTVAVVHALWRPPLPLVGAVPGRAPASSLSAWEQSSASPSNPRSRGPS
jgi:cytochrome c oxidase assembly protein subunit 15